MKRWYVRLPGAVYALGPIKARSKSALKQWAREWLGVNRLPVGFEFWRA